MNQSIVLAYTEIKKEKNYWHSSNTLILFENNPKVSKKKKIFYIIWKKKLWMLKNN